MSRGRTPGRGLGHPAGFPAGLLPGHATAAQPNRRQALWRLSAIAPWWLGGAPAGAVPALPADLPRLLIVFLRGGYDAAHLLVPIASSHYFEQRPNIAVARPGSGPDAALPLDADWGLNPALAHSMAPMFAQGQLALVPFAGSEDASRSHFDSQDGIELGQPLGVSRDYRSGFLNRLAQVLGTRAAIGFTDQQPLALRGALQLPNLRLVGLSRSPIEAQAQQLIGAMYRPDRLAASVQESLQVRDTAVDLVQRDAPQLAGLPPAQIDAARQAINAGGWPGEARRIGRLMQAHFAIGWVDVGGWDTHVNQGGGAGALSNQLRDLGQGLAALADELGPAWGQTTVVVLSEFGRTFKENGSRGTDHGHGSVYWVLGGGVRGGRVRGEQVAVTAGNLFQQRDYPVLNDYRALLGGLFKRQYGLSAAQLQQVFPGAQPNDLGLL